MEAASTPGQKAPLGVEIDPTLAYGSRDGFNIALEHAVLFPLSGLDNPELKLTRDGTGQRRQASPRAQGQPQGGQPNRSVPATGGAMTEIEVVDPERGGTQVEYRRDGRAIGAEDPEAGMSVPR